MRLINWPSINADLCMIATRLNHLFDTVVTWGTETTKLAKIKLMQITFVSFYVMCHLSGYYHTTIRTTGTQWMTL